MKDEPVANEKRKTNPVGILIGLGAMGLLLVLLIFQSRPDVALPPNQAPMAKALVDNLMTNGVLVDYDCNKSSAWINRGVWAKYNYEQQRNMVIGLATVCQSLRAGYRISVIDYDTKKEVAAFDGTNVRID